MLSGMQSLARARCSVLHPYNGFSEGSAIEGAGTSRLSIVAGRETNGRSDLA